MKKNVIFLLLILISNNVFSIDIEQKFSNSDCLKDNTKRINHNGIKVANVNINCTKKLKIEQQIEIKGKLDAKKGCLSVGNIGVFNGCK